VSLRQLRDALSVAQISIAVAAVALGSGASTWALIGALVLSAIAFWRKLPAETPKSTQHAWTALILVALVASVARAFLRAEFLDAGIDLMLLLVVQRLFNRQRCREHAQLLLLGAVLMVIAAVINADLNFPVLLAGYLVVATMAMIVNQLLSEGERLGSRVRHDLQRQGTAQARALWRASAQVAAIAGVGGLVVFLVFPRFGVGVFLRGALPTGVTSGFSDEVQLGGFGRIKNDTTVVMRMKPTVPMPVEERLTWHLRGSAFDHYERGRWSRSDAAVPQQRQLERAQQGFYVFLERGQLVAGPTLEAGVVPGRRRTIGPRSVPGFARSTEGARMSVTLEDIGTELLFVASEPLGVRLRARSPIEAANYRNLKDRGMRQIAILNKAPGPVQYEFLSRIGEPTARELRMIGDPSVPRRMQEYLQVPSDLSQEFRTLARDLTEGAQTRYEKVDAVMQYLAEFDYTLELRESERVQAGADPIEGFLFDIKAGHCEYYATAMALLLREAGVPTRNVNGYYGAHYNDVGDFYAVRQADAHSWVEVYFDGLGWITFDPTPPSGRTAGDDAALWPAATQLLDAVRNSYLEYVIDFNLGKQLALLEEMGIRDAQARRSVDRWALAIWLALPLAAGGAWFIYRRRRRRSTASPESVIYAKLLDRLTARGHVRGPGESARRFARRLADEGAPEADAMARFADAYERQRFGPRADAGAVIRLEQLARDVTR
jgi:transglutaminase-like putative cysteine protease